MSKFASSGGSWTLPARLPYATMVSLALVMLAGISITRAQPGERPTNSVARNAPAEAANGARDFGGAAESRFQSANTPSRADAPSVRAVADTPCQDCDAAQNLAQNVRHRRHDSEASDCRRPRVQGKRFEDTASTMVTTRCDRPDGQ